MIVVNVVVAERVNKLADFELGNMRDQMYQQRVRADVEGHAKKRVRRTLVELAVKHASILDFELKESVARRQIDVGRLARIPAGNDQAARIRIGANLVQEIRDLVDTVLLRIITAERAPEITIDWSKISRRPSKLCSVFFVGPLGPDIDPASAQVCLARITRQKPEQLFRDP